MPRIKIVENFS